MMENPYSIALAEVDTILSYTDKSILEKIPNSFKQFVKANKQKGYELSIESNVPLKQQKISKETKLILALLYRDYICDKDERKKLIEIENKQKEIIEKQKHDKFDIVFKNKNQKVNKIEKNTNFEEEKQLVEVTTKDKWYKTIMNKLKELLHLKK